MQNIGKVLRVIRYANNMTLNFASKATGVSARYINELEKGKKHKISYEYLNKLAEGYGLHMHQLERLEKYYSSFERLEKYYSSVEVYEERKFRLTLIKTLQMLEDNRS